MIAFDISRLFRRSAARLKAIEMKSTLPQPQNRNAPSGEWWTSQLVEAIVDDIGGTRTDRLAPSLMQCEQYLGELIEHIRHVAREMPFAVRQTGSLHSLSRHVSSPGTDTTISRGAVRRRTAPLCEP